MDKDRLIRRDVCFPAELHVRETAEGEVPSRTIAGYAILFNTPSDPLWDDGECEVREVVAPEAITSDFLDSQDIKMTMFHDRQLILARSNKGTGTLSYRVDGKGVSFEFEAPNTVDGDKALELVRRGDIGGCSFAFTTRYGDGDFVERLSTVAGNGKRQVTYRVKAITGVYDFTLAADPAYPNTNVEVRSFIESLRRTETKTSQEESKMGEEALRQLREMRHAAKRSLIKDLSL